MTHVGHDHGTGRTPPLGDAKYCAVSAALEQQDPIGTNVNATRLLFLEAPTPWGSTFYTPNSRGTLWQRLRAIQVAYTSSHQVDGHFVMPATGYTGFYGIAPDPAWSPAGARRAILATRPPGLVTQFDLAEYSFPSDSPALVDFVDAHYNAPQSITGFEAYRAERPPVREFFVCTHDTVDTCCARLGVPLFRQARKLYPHVRAWRTTHFGGHRFSPTAWEFPTSYKWAFLDEAATAHVLNRDIHPAELKERMRGWSGGLHPVQILDREGLVRYGWDWLDVLRRGEVVHADEDARRWQARLEFISPSGEHGVFEGEVGVRRDLDAFGCGREWGKFDTRLPEYGLLSFVARTLTATPSPS